MKPATAARLLKKARTQFATSRLQVASWMPATLPDGTAAPGEPVPHITRADCYHSEDQAGGLQEVFGYLYVVGEHRLLVAFATDVREGDLITGVWTTPQGGAEQQIVTIPMEIVQVANLAPFIRYVQAFERATIAIDPGA